MCLLAALPPMIQTVGFGPFGIRLPIIMGVTAVSISPMLAMTAMPGVGLTGIYGAVLVGGIFGLCVAPFVKYVLRFFPAVVTGTIITMIGVVLMRVGVNWAGGGAGKADFGAAGYLIVAGLVLALILLVIKFTRGFLQNVAVLIGITVGYLVTIALGWTDFSGIAEEPIVRVVMPLQFGVPQFFLIPCLTMCLVVMIVFIEATGMFLALGAMTGRKVEAEDVKRGLRADSLGTIIGAIFNTFPYVSYSQNIGLVGVTGVHSRWVCVAGGVIMLVLGLIPKLVFIVASVPQCVLGGAGFDRHQDPLHGRLCQAAPQRAGGRHLDRLRPDPDRVADLLPRLPRRAEADFRRRHHPDLDRRGGAQRLFQPHQPRAGRGRDLHRCASGGAYLSAGSIGFVVIASEAKQSKSCARELDCFRLRAPRFGGLKPAEAPTERRRVVAIASRNDDLRFD
jgi:uracil-xanthine permease